MSSIVIYYTDRKANSVESILSIQTKIEQSLENDEEHTLKRKKTLNEEINLQILQNNENIYDSYELKRVIGRGVRSVVKIALHKISNELRAVKIIRKSHIDETSDLVKEITALQSISHPNILHYYEFYQDESKYYLVFELCRGGDLLE